MYLHWPPRSAIVGDMTIRGILRGLRIYMRGWRPPPHISIPPRAAMVFIGHYSKASANPRV